MVERGAQRLGNGPYLSLGETFWEAHLGARGRARLLQALEHGRTAWV